MAGNKYLEKYAATESRLVQPLVTALPLSRPQWQFVLVVPAYNESPEFFNRLVETIVKKQSVLLILVLNQPDSNITISEPTRKLLNHLQVSTTVIAAQDHLSLRQIPGCAGNLLLIQRFGANLALPASQGVGLARKIGADTAATLIQSGHVSCPWIFNTDADCTLPENYFAGIPAIEEAAAIVYPFRHRTKNDRLGLATRLYEQSLHHYAQGLAAAGSPYAFPTIGSTLAISSHHYCLVRGFPKRAGGEDFYMLNKLAKTGAVVQLSQPTIAIEARRSERVPFGTGPAIKKIMEMADPEQEFGCYHPQIFTELSKWLAALPGLMSKEPENLPLPTVTINILNNMGITRARHHALRHSKSRDSFLKHMHTWFDGFRTLKFVHAMQDAGFPPVPVAEIICPARQQYGNSKREDNQQPMPIAVCMN